MLLQQQKGSKYLALAGCWFHIFLSSSFRQVEGFLHSPQTSVQLTSRSSHISTSTKFEKHAARIPFYLSKPLRASNDDEDEEDPMAEWRKAYPDLEFVDYTDPEYKVDQGDVETLGEDDTEERIEEMREERRIRNDEYQFETYYEEVLQSNTPYYGEWTVYKCDFNELDVYGIPALRKGKNILKIKSDGKKVITDPNAKWRVDGEHLEQEDVLAEDAEDNNAAFGETILQHKYSPSILKARDFRGPAGIMKVGNAHTICDTIPLNIVANKDYSDRSDDSIHEGPFQEMRTEVGIHDNDIRFRLKLDYRVPEEISTEDGVPPPLQLNTMIVCRERLNQLPRKEGYAPSESEIALFGPPGASGGLYDPPPAGTDEQAAQYIMLDLQGGATILFPFQIDQTQSKFGFDEDDKKNGGWVTSLDWSPGSVRYQVDRKVLGGKRCKNLKTLELTEVETKDADTWRPRDGGMDMRQ